MIISQILRDSSLPTHLGEALALAWGLSSYQRFTLSPPLFSSSLSSLLSLKFKSKWGLFSYQRLFCRHLFRHPRCHYHSLKQAQVNRSLSKWRLSSYQRLTFFFSCNYPHLRCFPCFIYIVNPYFR